MALPKLIVPNYSLTLPSNGKKLTYRPFLVKEEKIMLIAAQSQDPVEIKNAIAQIITNCILDPDFKVLETPTFDIIWILINLRIQSIGGKVTNNYTCQNAIVENSIEKKCNTPFEITYNLKDIEIIQDKTLSKEIKLSPQIGVKLRYPRFSIVEDMNETSDFDFTLLKEVIEFIYDAEGTYKLSEQSEQEINEFFESLTKDQFRMIEDFLAKLPRFEVNKEHRCESCGFLHKIKVDDLASFF